MSKAAFVTIVGRPSVGKSTLVNLLCKAKVAIVSPVPQTTRNAIRGIVNRPQGQLVFTDTPGRHSSDRKFNLRLKGTADKAVDESDLVLYVLDATRPPGEEEFAVAKPLTALQEKLVVCVNKMEIPGIDFKTISDFLESLFPALPPERRFLISARHPEIPEWRNTERLLDYLFTLAPEGEPFYPEDYYTDQEVSFRIAEIIREKAINKLRQELPHALFVDIAELELRDQELPRQRLWVRAFIMVERESQKGMVVGKGGVLVKAIRQEAQKELNKLFDWKIELDLRVKTAREWRHDERILKKLVP